MERIVAYCGLICSDCGSFIARKENDYEERREVAEAWSKEFGGDFKPEDINCEGCLTTDGQVFSHCNVCEIRKCGIERGVENCALCVDFSCEKLSKFLQDIPQARKTLEDIHGQLTAM